MMVFTFSVLAGTDRDVAPNLNSPKLRDKKETR